MQCTKCGTSNRDGIKFCEECGTRLSLACPSCGTHILIGKKFCGECGTALTASSFNAQTTSPILSVRQTQPQILHPHPPLHNSQPLIDHTPNHLVDRILSGKAALEGERKIVTVLFTDIRGSMDIMESLDPEEAKQLVDPCLQLMMQAVHRFEGTVNRILGDGIMALFGAPLALEDHPQRALYAALYMHDLVNRYAVEIRHSHGIPLQIRIGINTGEVVVRTIGNDLCMDYSAVGHAVGLAARMESLASPGGTLVTAHTYRFVHDAFQLAAQGAVKVKGVSTPLETYTLLAPNASHSRLAVRATQGLSPLVGRARELAHLHELVALTASGQGQIISLVGEAGVGKSRLLEELKSTLQDHNYLLIEGAAFPYGKTRAYLPWIEMFKRYCHISDQDDPQTYRDKLHEKLATASRSLQEYESVSLELFGIESHDPTTASLSAESRLRKVLYGTKQLIGAESKRQPVAFLLEDLQWLDTHSLDFLQSLTSTIAAFPVLLLLSYRPDQTGETRQSYPWESQSFAQRLQLTALQSDSTESLLTALVGTDPSLTRLIPVVSDKSGGNPFFLEEIVQHLLETGILTGPAGYYHLVRPLPERALPETVQGVLASRLDRLDPLLKQLLQTASVMGREFSRPLLAQVMGWPESDLDQACSALHVHEFIYEAAVYPDTLFAFKHALTQEVAYHSLLQESRAELHAVVGAAIETLYADKLQEYVTTLAYHYSRSATTHKAEQYLYSAGLRSVELYADTDAQHFWEEHLAVLETMPHGPDRDHLEVRTRLHLMNLLARQSSDDSHIQAQFAQTETVCLRLHDNRLLAAVHATVAGTYVLWGRPRAGLPHARTAYQLTAQLADIVAQVRAHGPLAHLLWLAGHFEESLQIAEAGLALVTHHKLLDTQPTKSAYPYIQCLAVSGICHGFLGDTERGLQQLRQANSTADHYRQRIPQTLSHWGMALLHALQGEFSLSQQEADNGLRVMQEIGAAASLLMAGAAQEYL
jgi:class 3 adenylate cyclase